ncbi:hypothetical protein GT204_11680 [Streptomyces sp. SID4919]|uniref:hypothetical protein n=1 Tax=unclassified Streptomyces TaxID=2593676 RepID=UPI000823A105|nr:MULTISPECIES: hypothetical protein [unclassified Streptomyces]MYY09557.1 hypothetical protein [Streptomyces sp. SID4919]SCK62451.1 hypothetical protein YW7DRAFT_06643 [Streptomyces sp. AmelKG-E11A]
MATVTGRRADRWTTAGRPSGPHRSAVILDPVQVAPDPIPLIPDLIRAAPDLIRVVAI